MRSLKENYYLFIIVILTGIFYLLFLFYRTSQMRTIASESIMMNCSDLSIILFNRYGEEGLEAKEIERLKLHEEIVLSLFKNKTKPKTSEQQLIFTAGTSGVGKTTVINKMIGEGNLSENEFVRIDIDQITKMLPEFNERRENIYSELKEEALMIAEKALMKAIAEGHNVIKEGLFFFYGETLLLAKIRDDYPDLRIKVLLVESHDLGEVTRRVEERERVTGRSIYRGLLTDESVEQIRDNVFQVEKNYNVEVIKISN